MAKAKKKETAAETAVTETVITAYKGFNADMTCRGFKFEIGKEYTHDGDVEACNSGFHSCEYPLDVFHYYAPASSTFAQVEASGKIDKHAENSKVASSKLSIKASLNIGDIVKAAIAFTMNRVKETGAASNSGDYGAASNSGTRGAASNSGTRGAASNSGYQGAASNSGTRGAASNSGTRGAASNSGYQGAASNSGYQGAASNSGDYGAASNSGDYGAASNSGDYGAASNSGYQGAASTEGKQTIAAVFGGDSKAKASQGNWIVLCYRTPFGDDGYQIKHVKSAQAGVTEGVKPDVWYKLNESGNFVEAA